MAASPKLTDQKVWIRTVPPPIKAPEADQYPMLSVLGKAFVSIAGRIFV